VKRLRETRDQEKTVEALTAMFRAEELGENVVRQGIDACKAYATVGELVGVLRMARGFPYDHYRQIPAPEYLKHLEKPGG
jgi:methylmalonyl-CoA mutase N-terminal domain/subunit